MKYLLKGVWRYGAVAALGCFGAIVTDVLTDAVPQVLCGQRSVHGHRKHGQKNDRLHSHRRAFDVIRRPHEAGARFFRFLRVAAVSRALLRRCEHIASEDIRCVRLVHVNKTRNLTQILFVFRIREHNRIDLCTVVATTLSPHKLAVCYNTLALVNKC